ncbi:nuclear transport factor 2 family protein [Chroococcus sp. FPU101]|uniref:nuclear transport factor 2 family protein n=1 Tax=Chroococcus sp. FPU101 TaxID=1974212 RepID=UPI001A8D1545|nr:nuclear transport factor 2 family protein [Chroococcus sp. FPU101]GFE72104.1 probable ketosteroid isomerase [Chroococcus sp. FPU101]
MLEETIKQVVTNYYSNLAAINLPQWLDTLDENALICDPVGTPPLNLAQDADKFFNILANFYQKFEINQDSVFVAGNSAAIKWTMQVTAKNSKTATVEGISTFEINEQGKIIKVLSYWDEMAMKAKLAS